MSDGASFDIDERGLDKASDRMVRRYLAAGTQAVATTTRDLEQRLEAATRQAVPGKLWRAWASNAFPKQGPAKNPAGTVFVKGGDRTRGAIKFWTEPGQIRGKHGQLLAIPLPAAGKLGRGRDLTPDEWERRTGLTLRFVPRRGRAPLLVVDDAVLSGRKQVAKGNTAGRAKAGRGSATVPIFVLLPSVAFGNSVAIQPIIAGAKQELPGNFIAAVRSTRDR